MAAWDARCNPLRGLHPPAGGGQQPFAAAQLLADHHRVNSSIAFSLNCVASPRSRSAPNSQSGSSRSAKIFSTFGRDRSGRAGAATAVVMRRGFRRCTRRR